MLDVRPQLDKGRKGAPQAWKRLRENDKRDKASDQPLPVATPPGDRTHIHCLIAVETKYLSYIYLHIYILSFNIA